MRHRKNKVFIFCGRIVDLGGDHFAILIGNFPIRFFS